MQIREEIIKNYFKMWVTGDFSKLDELLSQKIYYSECYGPEYHNLNEVKDWISDLQKKQKVVDWTCKRFIHATDVTVVEWFFKAQENSVPYYFDGVSIVEFENNKIIFLKEFESKSDHYAPYNKKTQ